MKVDNSNFSIIYNATNFNVRVAHWGDKLVMKLFKNGPPWNHGQTLLKGEAAFKQLETLLDTPNTIDLKHLMQLRIDLAKKTSNERLQEVMKKIDGVIDTILVEKGIPENKKAGLSQFVVITKKKLSSVEDVKKEFDRIESSTLPSLEKLKIMNALIDKKMEPALLKESKNIFWKDFWKMVDGEMVSIHDRKGKTVASLGKSKELPKLLSFKTPDRKEMPDDFLKHLFYTFKIENTVHPDFPSFLQDKLLSICNPQTLKEAHVTEATAKALVFVLQSDRAFDSRFSPGYELSDVKKTLASLQDDKIPGFNDKGLESMFFYERGRCVKNNDLKERCFERSIKAVYPECPTDNLSLKAKECLANVCSMAFNFENFCSCGWNKDKEGVKVALQGLKEVLAPDMEGKVSQDLQKLLEDKEKDSKGVQQYLYALSLREVKENLVVTKKDS